MTQLEHLAAQAEDRDPVYTCAGCGATIDTEVDPMPVEAMLPNPHRGGLNPFATAYFCNQVCCSEAAYKAVDTATGRAELLALYAGLRLVTEAEVEHRAEPATHYGVIDDIRIGEPGAWKFLSLAEFKQAARAFLAQLEPAGDEVAWAVPASKAVGQLTSTLSGSAQESLTANVSGKKVQ